MIKHIAIFSILVFSCTVVFGDTKEYIKEDAKFTEALGNFVDAYEEYAEVVVLLDEFTKGKVIWEGSIPELRKTIVKQKEEIKILKYRIVDLEDRLQKIAIIAQTMLDRLNGK